MCQWILEQALLQNLEGQRQKQKRHKNHVSKNQGDVALGPQVNEVAPIKSKSGELIRDKNQQLGTIG